MNFFVTNMILVLFFATIIAGLIIVATKWGWLDWYDSHRKRWMPERCEFCLAFWLGLLFGLTQFPIHCVIPYSLCIAVITRKLL